MTTVNEKGGHYMTLTVLQTESAEANCMLKESILKKSENWAVQLTDFVLSKQPPINLNMNEPFLEIKHYETEATDIVDLTAIYGNRTVFTPKKCISVIELFRQLKQFCMEFSALFLRYGLGDGQRVFVPDDVIDDWLTNLQRPVVAFDIDEGAFQLDDVLTVSLDVDLKIQFEFNHLFCQDFYIQLSDYASRIVGLPAQLFHVVGTEDGVDTFSNTASLANPTIYNGTVYVDTDHALQYRFVLEDLEDDASVFAVKFKSTESIKNFDERLSLDLISTFPVSRKVSIFNGNQSEEYLLGRFDVSSFRNFEMSGKTVNNRMEYYVKEKFHPAAYNLTEGYPNYESNHFINGPIQSINFRLMVRYINEKNIIKSVPLDMKDGYFQVQCFFSKKL